MVVGILALPMRSCVPSLMQCQITEFIENWHCNCTLNNAVRHFPFRTGTLSIRVQVATAQSNLDSDELTQIRSIIKRANARIAALF